MRLTREPFCGTYRSLLQLIASPRSPVPVFVRKRSRKTGEVWAKLETAPPVAVICKFIVCSVEIPHQCDSPCVHFDLAIIHLHKRAANIIRLVVITGAVRGSAANVCMESLIGTGGA